MFNVGIDLTTIKRFDEIDILAIKRFLSKSEFDEYLEITKTHTKDFINLFLATRWALKEAIFKADNRFYEFKKINITKHDNVYHFENFSLSTSNENGMVIAIAIKN
ncbi:4'-phosphopantetheinyl transferase superfamily protein [[Mycoplasma] gypis]|uniref:4'-phosphopantetheinyl transferase superfamily protein n=1 Tax=[Mycoplasma] gypis TaxID=92404 RepID=A0ABZ2RR60_9BACT|nr:4'-phosphopantetheinyl transferase superfamily protein [[Mycoplasma] gypis]MBN0919258.1 4'-phosphopantetheinyl transferase superfamily protein [[Mycoplasma] gypis]